MVLQIDNLWKFNSKLTHSSINVPESIVYLHYEIWFSEYEDLLVSL